MQTFFIVAILGLGFLITFQIAKASEYVAVLRGEEKARKQTNKVNAFMLLAFLITGLIGVYYCNVKLSGKTLGEAASDHGVLIDRMLYITIGLTGIVFVITQVALFWFSFKYQESDTRKAYYYPHNNKLELIWTVIPAIALTVLVGFGLFYWFKITGDAPKNAMQVEVVGKQFGWEFRYPGRDGILGKKYFKNIDAAKNNPVGQIWEDPANHDDLWMEQEMHLVVNKPVKLIIGAKDVIHDVGLAHFRMKMDAVPGMVTRFTFTPILTTKEMREVLGQPEFNYELACAEVCGRGHFSMSKKVIVVDEKEYSEWLNKQPPMYDPKLNASADVQGDLHTSVEKPEVN